MKNRRGLSFHFRLAISVPFSFLSVLFLQSFTFAQSLIATENPDTQNLFFAHSSIDSLCSPRMHGRGYVSSGDRIAANFIAGQFLKLGLKPLPNSFSGPNSSAGPNSASSAYFQTFSFPINTFPTPIHIRIGGNELIPGKDFLVRADCPSIKGQFAIADSTDYLSTKISTKKFYLLKNQKENSSRPAGLLFIRKKLTWDASVQTGPYCTIDILDSALSKIPSFTDKKVTIAVDIKNRFIKDHQTQNVIGYVCGTQHPDSFMVFTAHYDHLGQMGSTAYFPGANDNASGCAMLLCLARYYSVHPPTCSVVFMAFAGEEAGLLGSRYFVEHPLIELGRIKFLINLDLIGTGDEGICVVNATVFKTEFDLLKKLNDTKAYFSFIKPRGKARISDHFFFTESGVKSFYIYTLGGIKAYHDIYDRPETLPLTKFTEAFKLLRDFTDVLSN